MQKDATFSAVVHHGKVVRTDVCTEWVGRVMTLLIRAWLVLSDKFRKGGLITDIQCMAVGNQPLTEGEKLVLNITTFLQGRRGLRVSQAKGD